MKKFLAAAVLLAGAMLSLAYAYPQPQGQPTGGGDNPLPAIQAIKNAYVAAFNKGDLDGVMAAWAPNAEYIDDEGNITEGKAAITELFKKSLAESKGWTLKVEGKSLRVLRPDLVVVDGMTELTSPEGDKENATYTSIWARQDGKWQLISIRDLGSSTPARVVDADALLKELDWMVGDWSHQDAQATVKLTVKRALNRFLMLEYTIQQAGAKETMQVRQYVGYDPLEEQLHSWVFDSTGGFGQSTWRKHGKTWRSYTTGVLASGEEGSSVNAVKQVDENSFTWRSEERSVGDAVLPDVEIKFTRVK